MTTDKAGQSWAEQPATATASAPMPARRSRPKLLAVFVVDTNETELVIPFGN